MSLSKPADPFHCKTVITLQLSGIKLPIWQHSHSLNTKTTGTEKFDRKNNYDNRRLLLGVHDLGCVKSQGRSRRRCRDARRARYWVLANRECQVQTFRRGVLLLYLNGNRPHFKVKSGGSWKRNRFYHVMFIKYSFLSELDVPITVILNYFVIRIEEEKH